MLHLLVQAVYKLWVSEKEIASLCLLALMEYFTLVLSSCFLNAEKLGKKEWPSVQSVVVSSWIQV